MAATDMVTTFEDVGFGEGPVLTQDSGVLFTSIDRGLIMHSPSGHESPEVIARLGGGPNGAVELSDGSIVVAQNGGAYPGHPTEGVVPGVQMITPERDVVSIAHGLTAPNDLAVGPDGHVYVTDPTRKPERDEGKLWRVNVGTQEKVLIAELDWYPNGIGFGPDDRLYVADTKNGQIVRFVSTDAPLDASETVIHLHEGLPDGFAFDAEGNILVAAVRVNGETSSVQCWSPGGTLIASFDHADCFHMTNVAVGPSKRAVVTDSGCSRVLSFEWQHAGLPLHPFRPGSVTVTREGIAE